MITKSETLEIWTTMIIVIKSNAILTLKTMQRKIELAFLWILFRNKKDATIYWFAKLTTTNFHVQWLETANRPWLDFQKLFLQNS